MWQHSVFETVARLSSRGTTVATFTSTGQVRRDLANLGFAMTKVDQRPFKRASRSENWFAQTTLKPWRDATPTDQCSEAGIAGAGGADS